MDRKRILLVEDDPSLGYVIQDNLVLKGYDVTLCADGSEGEQAFLNTAFHLCILDVMLPRKDGFSLARSIREKSSDVPIIFLTAKTMLEDKLKGFETGADDYITKPFSLDELFYRIEVFLRRTQDANIGEKVIKVGKFQFDPFSFTLRHDDLEKTLTQKEAEVLNQIIRDAIQNTALSLQEKNGTIRCELEAGNHVINADRLHLTNVLYNLIDNAIKYCSDAPRILITTVNDSKSLCIAVKDNGLGIARENHRKVFQKFYRIGNEETRSAKGTGLGLYLCKKIADNHDATIKISENSPKGTKIIVKFTKAKADQS